MSLLGIFGEMIGEFLTEAFGYLGAKVFASVGLVFGKIVEKITGKKPEKMTDAEFGAWAEEQAGKFLKKKGMKILTCNYRTAMGELDVVARDGEFVVFVEVKAVRQAGSDPHLKVNREKRRRMIASAEHYIAHGKLHDRPARFDIVTVESEAGGKTRIEHEENAFEA